MDPQHTLRGVLWAYLLLPAQSSASLVGAHFTALGPFLGPCARISKSSEHFTAIFMGHKLAVLGFANVSKISRATADSVVYSH